MGIYKSEAGAVKKAESRGVELHNGLSPYRYSSCLVDRSVSLQPGARSKMHSREPLVFILETTDGMETLTVVCSGRSTFVVGINIPFSYTAVMAWRRIRYLLAFDENTVAQMIDGDKIEAPLPHAPKIENEGLKARLVKIEKALGL